MKKLLSISMVVCLVAGLQSFRADDDFITRLQSRLTSYFEHRVPVKLYVSLDQPEYIPGDTLRYKIILVTDVMNRLIGERQVIQIHLVDHHNIKRFSASVLINKGVGTGTLVLPPTLISGLYMLQAYHNTMRNKMPPCIFQRPLIIGGEFSVRRTENEVAFFPESGRVIAGVSNRVVVRGTPLFKTAIFEDDLLIASVSCDSAGWGDFYFVPKEKAKYFFESNAGSRVAASFEITEGVSMLVSGVSTGTQLRVAVHSSERIRKESPYTLVLSVQDEILFGSTVDFSKKKSHVISFPKNNMRTGIHAVTLFTSNGEVVSERLFFFSGKDPKLTLSTNKSIYHVRDAVTVTIKVPTGIDVSTLGVSVYQEELFNGAEINAASLQEYFDLTAGLPEAFAGTIAQGESMDRFMVSQKIRNFSWKDVWEQNSAMRFEFEPYLRLSGRAIFRSTGLPVPDSTFIQFFMQNEVAGYESITHRDGTFSFPLLFDFYGDEDVHFVAEAKGTILRDVQIVPEDFHVPVEMGQWVATTSRDRYVDLSKKRMLISHAYDQVRPEVRKEQVWLNDRVEDAVGGADVTVRLSDYLLFPTMHETLLEIVPAVKSRADRNLVRVSLVDEQFETKSDPLYIIDGVLCDDTGYFLSLNPADVVSIKVINKNSKLSIIGGMARSGVILVDTRIPDHATKIPLRENVFSASGLTVSHGVSGTFRKKMSEREPDIRPVLYWNPQVSVVNGEASVTFYCADNIGTFNVVAEGITTDGRALAQDCSFEVVFRNP